MLVPPPPKLKNIRRARAYSFNKKGELVLRPAPVTKKRPRTFSYRKTNGNFAKVSVKRGSKELTGQDRRTRIYELLYFIPTTVMKALTPKQLDQLLLAHQCAICLKVFRLSSGVKFHIKDKHENRTLLGFFKKTEDVNNNKENGKPQALGERTPEKDKNNQSVLVRKPSIKNYFCVSKPPRYIAKPSGLTPLRCRSRQEIPKTNKDKKYNSPEREDFTRLTPLLDNLRKSSTLEKEQMLTENTKIAGKPKLMSGKTWQKKNLSFDSESSEVKATPPAVSSNFPSPTTPRRPKLSRKNRRKRMEAQTPQINKAEGDLGAIPSPEIPDLSKDSLSAVALTPFLTYKPKLMTNKTWRGRKLSPAYQVNPNKHISDNCSNSINSNVKDTFDFTLAGPSLLDKVGKIVKPTTN